MTIDELENKIIEIKKKGLPKIVELNQLREVRSEFYKKKVKKAEEILSSRVLRNISFLSKTFKSYPTSSNIKEFMGVDVSIYYDSFMKNEKGILPFRDMYVIALYYGVPINLFMFEDLEVHGEQIWKEYNTVFKQSKH